MYSGTPPSAPGSGSSSLGSNTLQPTFTGYVASTKDALILFEACLIGHLNHIPRRPNERERNSLIHSGCVFIYVENASGIKRWTDGVTWSPSRILGNFLVYRELDRPFPPGEKKKVIKKQERRAARPGEPYPRPDGTGSYSPATSQPTSFSNAPASADAERQLIGSLTSSYGFKFNGLVKKTISVKVLSATHHLISYYNMDNVKMGLLQRPSHVLTLSAISPRQELTSNQSFRVPVEEVEEADGAGEGHQGIYGGYRPMDQQGCCRTSNSYYPYAAYPQHGQQQGASAGYAVGPPMSVGSIPQMAAPQITFREGQYNEYNQQTCQNYEPSTSRIPPQSHPNGIPTPPLALPPEYPTRPPSQAQHPSTYPQVGLQHYCSKSN
jgi:hypothetical protein